MGLKQSLRVATSLLVALSPSALALDAFNSSTLSMLTQDLDLGRVLVYGSIPTNANGTSLLMTELTTSLGSLVDASTFYLSIVSLLPNATSSAGTNATMLENAWASANPSSGRLISWPTYGDIHAPKDVDSTSELSLIKSFNEWQIDSVWQRTSILYHWLKSSASICASKNFEIIYIHDGHSTASGDNVIGLVGVYMMRYLGYTRSQVLSKFEQIGLGYSSISSLNTLEWAEAYIAYRKSVSASSSSSTATSTCSGAGCDDIANDPDMTESEDSTSDQNAAAIAAYLPACPTGTTTESVSEKFTIMSFLVFIGYLGATLCYTYVDAKREERQALEQDKERLNPDGKV